MAEFFHLNQQDIENPANAEDKVIAREQRIFADNVIFANGDTYKVKTTSTAYRQKLKFFVDVVEYTDPDTLQTFKYRCGYYYECEHYESVRLFTSLGFMSFYFVIDKIFEGEYDFSFYISNENVKLYVSSVVFEDSFYNPEKGWLNPNNPDNIIDELEDDDDPNVPTIPGYTGGGSMIPYFVSSASVEQYLQGVTIYEDSFCIVQVYRSASSIGSLNFLLKGEYKPLQSPVNTAIHGLFTQDILQNSANRQNYVYPSYAITWTDNGTNRYDGVGFSIPIATTTQNSYIMNDSFLIWDAEDGYSYGLKFIGNCGSDGSSGLYASCGAYFLGRTPTLKNTPFN